jgi:hypothetical protein
MGPSSPRNLPETIEDNPVLHQLKNHLSVIVGYCDLLLRNMPADDRTRNDIVEMHKAGQAAIELLPHLTIRVR